MVLKLRLARPATPGGSKRHAPRYNIVLAQSRTARDSKPLEVLGTYNPIPQTPIGAEPGARQQKDIKLDVSRAKYWLGVGAQPSDTVWRLMAMIGLLEPKYLPSGEQQENALKAVRFPTHVAPSAREGKNTRSGVYERVKAARQQEEVRAAEVRAAEVQAAEVRAAEVRAAEVQAAEVQAAEVQAADMAEGATTGSVAGTTSAQDPNAV